MVDDAANMTGKPVIVAIGASAGGVRALQAFFEAMPADTGTAFVVVVHLDPQHRSEMPSILAACTKMPVAQVGAVESLQPDHVYIIPPDRRLQITDHEISASEFDEPRGHRAPIDLFFRSLAEQHGDGFAVVLTGAGSDGSIGARAVKEAGGIILVQDPAEAEYPSMPRAAIATGAADVILPVRELVQRLAELIRSKDAPSIVEAGQPDEDELRRILAYLRARTGHDFSKYKRSTVLRRIARRMQVTRAETLSGYHDVLRDDANEAMALLADLLISVTTFFRDGTAFDALKTQVLPLLFRDLQPGDWRARHVLDADRRDDVVAVLLGDRLGKLHFRLTLDRRFDLLACQHLLEFRRGLRHQNARRAGDPDCNQRCHHCEMRTSHTCPPLTYGRGLYVTSRRSNPRVQD